MSKTAYKIPIYDGKTMDVQHSANAWWMDETKIPSLLAAFKIDATIPQACAYAGITLRQYKYFVSLHPEFNELRILAKEYLPLVAKRNLARAIESGDPKISMKYLEKRLPEEFGRKKRKKPQGLKKWERAQRLKEQPNIPGVTASHEEDVKLAEEFRERLQRRD